LDFEKFNSLKTIQYTEETLMKICVPENLQYSDRKFWLSKQNNLFWQHRRPLVLDIQLTDTTTNTMSLLKTAHKT